MIISGRVGFADFINGHFDAQVGILNDGLPTYVHEYTVGGHTALAGSQLYLYFSRKNGSWAISQELGGEGIVAYCRSQALRPELVEEPWFISDVRGNFLIDDHVRCGMSLRVDR